MGANDSFAVAMPTMFVVVPSAITIRPRDAESYRDGYADGIASAPVDLTPPTVTLVSPAEGVLAASDVLVFDVDDESELAYFAVFVETSSIDGKLCAYRRGGFERPFDVFSYVSTPAPGVTRVHLRHNSGMWPPGGVSVTVDAADGGGNLDA